MTSPRDQFARTYCDCERCSRFCTTIPGMLIPGDVERIAEHLDMSPVEVEEAYLDASPGAVVSCIENGLLRTYRIRTIVPRTIGGRCVFLDPHGACQIYSVAPYGCSHFDDHMSSDEVNERSKAGLIEIVQSAEYSESWGRLRIAGHYGRSPEEKRQVDFGAGAESPV